MNEKEARELMQNIDNDLMDHELDALMEGIEIDFDSISQKAHDKLNKEKSRMKKRKLYPVAAAAVIVTLGLSSVYASELSAFVKSFFNTKEMYGTIVSGTSYYLENPVSLDDGRSLDKVIFTKDTLDMRLTYPLTEDKVPKTECKTKNGDIYTPGGYSLEKNNGLSLLFMNQDYGYEFSPAQEIELTIEGKSYTIHLTEATSVAAGGEIIPAVESTGQSSGTPTSLPVTSQVSENAETSGEEWQPTEQADRVNIDWINLGYKKTEKGIMIVTSFSDEELKLDRIGKPTTETSTITFRNEGNSSFGSGTAPGTAPLIGYDEEQNTYEFKPDANADRFPIIHFESDNPDGKEITLKVPAIMVGYQKEFAEFAVDIPALNEKNDINREIDLQLQKMVLQSIERTSETTAVLKFKTNIGDKREVRIWDADVSSADVNSGEVVWEDGLCTMQVTFEKDLENIKIWVGWPHFVVTGDWTLIIK